MAHMHYTGTGKMHSFRGLLADGDQRKISIQGSVGAIAWRITKFNLMPSAPGTVSSEHVVKVYREEQSSVDGLVNFTDAELLGAAYYNANVSGGDIDYVPPVIFDNDLFSRNIYITHSDVQGAGSVNYYIELEEVKISAAGMAQLSVAAARRVYIPGT